MNIVILAAGMGKRMRSTLPKVLHPVAGRPLLAHVLAAARSLVPHRLVVIYGHGGEAVPRAFADATDITWVRQEPQLGTGHAVAQALPYLDASEPTLVLFGDVPLTRRETLAQLLEAAKPSGMALLTLDIDDPTGYGRIVRKHGRIVRIVEEKDASPEERAIREINTGILIAPTEALDRWLAQLSNQNAQGEYYLTDVIGFAADEGFPIGSTQPSGAWETLGVNSKVQLAELERLYQTQIARGLLDAGVTLADPARLDVRGELTCGADVFIDVGCVFEGTVRIGDGARLGPYCVVRDAEIGPAARIESFSHIEGAKIGRDSRIGPYARLRPGADLAEGVHIGNFVEVKNARIAAESKANHLAYVGDSVVGARVNIGAGTITCNYDGANKHETIIEDDVHIGSDTQLVAPVRVGAGATIGAGTTVWRDVAPGGLVTNSKTQNQRSDWVRPKKAPKKS